MTQVVCPIECLANPNPPDFLEKHTGFVISMVGILGGGLGVLLSYFLKSRCTKIKCCGVGCDRQPVELDQSQIDVVSNSNS